MLTPGANNGGFLSLLWGRYFTAQKTLNVNASTLRAKKSASLFPAPVERPDPRKYGLRERDSVVVIRGAGMRPFSFRYGSVPVKAIRLRQHLASIEGKIQRLQTDTTISREEKQKRMRTLRCEAKYLSGKLANEYAEAPVTLVIIEEG